MSEPASEPSRLGVLPQLAIALAVAATFARAVPYPLQLHWDDGRFIRDNPAVQQLSLDSLRSMFGAIHFEAYHPLHLLSYWLDVPWTGASPAVIHSVSLALWVGAALVLLRFMLACGLSLPFAAIACLLTTLHPAQVEAVSWATGRKDVLALGFVAASGALHLRSRTGWDLAAWGSRVAYLFAVLSKTTALPWPFVLLLGDVLLRGLRPGPALRRQLPSLVLGAALAAAVIAIWRDASMVRMTLGGLFAAPARMAATLAHQLGTALWPSDVAPMYSTSAIADPGVGVWSATALLVVLIWLALRSGAPLIAFGIAAFAVLMLPVSNLVPMYFPLQDRYLSLPLLGLAMATAAALERLRPSLGRVAVLGGFALALALALRCMQYQGVWSSEARLWGHAASAQPDAFYAWLKLGEVRRESGDLYGAIRAYRRLVEVDPARKLGHAALFESVALRDEAIHGLAPSRARAYAERYYRALDDAAELRALSSTLLSRGYLRALELPLGRALELMPFPDAALERAASQHFLDGRPSVGLFYLRQMRTPTVRPELIALAEAAAARYDGAP